MKSNISEQIAAFPSLSRAELLALWKENYSQEPPPSLSRVLLVQILAYRLQEKASSGGLSGGRTETPTRDRCLGQCKGSNPYDGTGMLNCSAGDKTTPLLEG